MLTFPNAKINLGLYITERRSDGYHNIESVFFPVPWCDALEIVPSSQKTSFQSTGIPIPGDAKDNLCLQAYELLRKDFGLEPVKIHLHKVIPIGAGLGGGSSDASYTLRLISELNNLFLEDDFLEDYAAMLGSDCPFFIGNQPVVATGTGTDFTAIELDLSGKHLALVYPGIHIGTKEAYEGVTPKAPSINLGTYIQETPIDQWRDTLHNDFEDSIFPNHPQLAEVKQGLYDAGALYASMTGSGATLFGIFDHAPTLPAYPANYTVFTCQL